jgi:hypothetical protein
MALLDPALVALGTIDDGLAALLPALPRLVLWGAAAGAAAMAVYRLCSNQGRIRSQQQKVKQARGAMLAAGPDASMLELSTANLKASFGLLGMVVLPGLVSALPVLLVLVWLAGAYGFTAPQPGAEVRIAATPADVGLTVDPESAANTTADGILLIWPADPAAVHIADSSGTIVERLPGDPPIDVVAKRQWWNALLGNPAGYLPDTAAADAVTFELPRRELLGFGPGWLRGWEATFIASVLIASIAIKLVFRIA